jgi:hypothetical protein
MAADVQGTAATVTIEGNRVAHAQSFIAKSTGNEVARTTGGGIITHNVQGAAYFQTFSMDVFIEGQPAVRHLDLLTHNHMGKLPGNTPPAPWMSMMHASPGPAPGEVSKDAREGKDWIEVVTVDVEGEVVACRRYAVTTPGGRDVKGTCSPKGTAKLLGLKKGNCKVAFPELDNPPPSSPARRPTDKLPMSPADRGKKSKADKIYEPGKSLTLATGRSYRVELPCGPSFWLELTIRRREAEVQGCAYVLRSDDGKYEVRRTLAEDLQRNEGTTVLQFPDLMSGRKYTLSHVLGEDGGARILFQDVPYARLRTRAPDMKGNQPSPKQQVDDVPAGLRELHLAELRRHRDHEEEEVFPGLVEEPE